MARVPVEVLKIGGIALTGVSAAIALANAEQDEFVFHPVSKDIERRMQMHAFARTMDDVLFTQIVRTREDVRGYHPFIIAVIDSELEGEKYRNLFGAHRAETGLAIFTTAFVAGPIIPADRMVAYFIYFFARYALSFLSPDHDTHEETRGCVFDFKANKRDIVKSMRERALCDNCRRSLVEGRGTLSADQFAALERLFALSGRIFSNGIEADGRPRIFIGSSSEGIDIAEKLQELLSDRFSVVIWNQGTVFGLGDSTLEALEAAVLEYHYGVFVFTPDDEVSTRGQVRPVARDNVLFELGIFIGKLGRKKTFVVRPGSNSLSLPSDLAGITTASYNVRERNLAAALGPVANQIRRAVTTA